MTPLLELDAPVPTRPERNGLSVMERMMRRTSVAPNECWVYRGALGRTGYGRVYVDPVRGWASAHRVAYEQLVGSVPAGLEIDHICLTRNCLNPQHMRVVTHLENVRHGRTNQNDGKTHCVYGHPFPPDRVCRPCAAARMRLHRAKKEATS